MRTYLYKLTSDRGGAPCAPPPQGDEQPLLTLAICKPAIRRTAGPGDRILGLTSRALVERDGYPADAIVYAAVVARGVDFRDYYAAESAFAARPDCVYRFDAETGELVHGGHTPLHAESAYGARDVGAYPYYRNARVLVCEQFRYFGRAAVPIPPRFDALLACAQALGQGHRVFERNSTESVDADALWKLLWRRRGAHTPAVVTGEAAGHTPRAARKPLH